MMDISDKDKTRMTTMIGILLACLIVGGGSVYFLGKDNKIEAIAESEGDKELNLAPGTIEDVVQKIEGDLPAK
ncbi:MAG: hypothetical protein ACRDE5_03615 [Ginsengibacter sp.]